jgi:Glycosyltransferase family 87
MKENTGDYKKGWYVFYLTVAVGGFLYAFIVACKKLWKATDFNCTYSVATAINMGHNIFHACAGYVYPPFFAFLFSLLAMVPYIVSKAIWLIITVFFLFVSLIFGFKFLIFAFQLKFDRWQAIGACSLALIFTGQSIYMEFKEGQSDILSLAAITFSLYFLKAMPFFSGLLLGVSAGIKYQTIIFLPLLLLRARWRAALGFVSGFALTVFLPALKIGWNTNFEYWHSALRGIKEISSSSTLPASYAVHMPSILWKPNIGLTNGVIRIFLDQGWSMSAAIQLVSAIAIILFLIVWWSFRQYNIPFLWRNYKYLDAKQETIITIIEFSLVIMGLLTFSPEVIRRHLLILVPVNLLAAILVIHKNSSAKKWLMILLILTYQIGLLQFYHTWSYWGGPGLSLIPAFFMILIGGLALYRDLYGTESSDLTSRLDMVISIKK